MSVIIRLQNLPLTAISIDIRNFFRGLSIPDGGVHIVGGAEGDAFIAFSTDEDARQAMQLSGEKLKDSSVRLLLSSRNEMFKVIEQARIGATLGQTPPGSTSSGRSGNNSPSSPSTSNIHAPTSTTISQTNPGNFQSAPPGMLGVGLGIGGANNFLHQAQGMHLPGINNQTGFPTSMTASHQHMLGAVDVNASSGNTTPFGMTTSIPGMGMSYPNLISNVGSGLPMSPATMMSMGMPPPTMMNLNLQNSVPFQGPRGMNNVNNNGMNMNGNAGNMHTPPNMGGAPPISSHVRPNTFPNINAHWASGAGIMGSSPQSFRPSGPVANAIRAPGLSTNNIGKDKNVGMMGNGPVRQNPIPSRVDLSRERKSRSNSRERRDGGISSTRRRRSRSRERDRNERRRRSSRSRSRSRSPKGRTAIRRDSRDKDDRRNKGDSSPDKGRGRRDSRDSDPPPNAYNMTEEEYPGIKLSGIPNDASFREIKDFLRVEILGGGDGTVRLYDENVAYVKLEKPSDYPRAYRSNGRKLRNSVVSMEGISIERWVNEYKLNKTRMERDVDRDREKERERERNRDRDDRGSERPDRSSRPSRFNSAAQSSYIVIRNLPPTITSRDVSSRLLKDASMIDMVVSAGPPSNGRHTAIAFVKLDSPQAAKQTIDNIFRSNDGVNLVVETCNIDDFNRAKNRTTLTGGTSNIGRLDVDPKSLGDTKSIFDLESGLDDESCSVMLKGAPPNVSERDVFDFFSDIGLVPMNVKVMYDTHGSCNGQIVCEFPDPHKARRATTKDGMLFGRGHVQVELIPSGRKRAGDSSVHMKGLRPALLGPRPIAHINPRFGIPPGPNPFVQALQIANGGPPRPPRLRGPNPTRFNSRNEFSASNGADRDDRTGTGRGRGSSTTRIDDTAVGTSQGPSFGKQGCILALENVPFKASMDDILHHLSSILKLEISREKIIRRFDDAEKPTGDARVAFDTPLEAKLAHDRLMGTKMWNRPITYTIL